MIFKNLKKAQGALEYLLLIGGAVLIAVIVIALIVGMSGQGRDSAHTQATQVQSTLDFSLPVAIVDVKTEENSCSDGGLGTFTIFYNPLGQGGTHELIIEDYVNRKLDLTSDGNLTSGSYSATKVLDLSSYPNLKCTDTYRAYIRTTKNGQTTVSSPHIFFWDSDAGSIASFTTSDLTAGTLETGGFYSTNPTFDFEVTLSGYEGDGTYRWYLASDPTLIDSCNNNLNCDNVSVTSSGVHHVIFKAFESVADVDSGDPVIVQNSPEIIVCNSNDCSLTGNLQFQDASQTTKSTFSPEETIFMNPNVSSDLDDGANYTYTYKYGETTLGTNNCGVFSIAGSNINSGALGNYDISVIVKENKTNLTVTLTNNLTLDATFYINITEPNDSYNYDISGNPIVLETNYKYNSGSVDCQWYYQDSPSNILLSECSGNLSTFREGLKTLIVKARDSENTVYDQINISGVVGDSLSLISPIPNNNYQLNEKINFNVCVDTALTSGSECANESWSYSWSYSENGGSPKSMGTGSNINYEFKTPGEKAIVLTYNCDYCSVVRTEEFNIIIEGSQASLSTVIVQPETGSEHEINDQITFNYEIIDGSGNYICNWYSNETLINQKCDPLKYNFSELGEKVIKLEITDKSTSQTVSDQIIINIIESETSNVLIISPENNASIHYKSNINFKSKINLENVDTCDWYINDSKVSENCDGFYIEIGNLGDNSVFLIVRDKFKNILGQDSININIYK